MSLRRLGLGDLKQGTLKSEAILIRVTPAEKEEIKAVAEALDISVSEYVLSLHRHVRDRV